MGKSPLGSVRVEGRERHLTDRPATPALAAYWTSRSQSLYRPPPATGGYFNAVLIDLYVLLTLVPRPLTPAIIATLIPPAMSAYSMAVAADSSAV